MKVRLMLFFYLIILLCIAITGCEWACYKDAEEAAARQSTPFFEQTDVYIAGQDGVHTYRIPSLIITKKGTVLAFCEARKESIADASPTDLVVKRSLDNGRTWQPMQIVLAGKGVDAIMNPTPVIDRKDGTIFLLCNTFKGEQLQQILILTSKDDGATWSGPTDIKSMIEQRYYPFVPGPGVGIQLKSGRLVIPGYTCTTDYYERDCFSLALYSDDHGRTWRESARITEPTDEAQVVELLDGTLMLNIRSNRRMSCRAISISKDGGETWSQPYDEKQLNEVPCQASFTRFPEKIGKGVHRLLFSNPDVHGKDYYAAERMKMTVRMSYDEGKTWPISKLLHDGPSSYSCLAITKNGMILCLYEGGLKHRREWLRLARFNLAWLTDGKDTLGKN